MSGTNGTENTAACNNYVLDIVEPINWAYITRSGHSQAPANLMMNPRLQNGGLACA